MSNIITLETIKKDIKRVFKAGYGHTIELKINGEYYEVRFKNGTNNKQHSN